MDKMYLFIKDPFEPKYQIPINRREIVGIKYDESILNMMINHKQLIMSMKV